ncbi:hypothetical protein AALC25_09210 [Lachnospiraceae bacterium 29-84]
MVGIGKDLQKLRRQELLELLLEQSKEAARLLAEHEETDYDLRQIGESNQRLEAKMEEKDTLNDKLQGRLDSKEERIQELEVEIEAWRNARQKDLGESRNLAEAAIRLNGVLEAARRATEQYLYNIRQRCGRPTQAVFQQSGEVGGSEK